GRRAPAAGARDAQRFGARARRAGRGEFRAPARGSGLRPRMFLRLYDRVLIWSCHRHARRYLAGLSFAEATFFPVPPDVMLAPMVLAERASAWRLAALTTAASVIGGLFGYLIGWLAIEAILPLIERVGYIEA